MGNESALQNLVLAGTLLLAGCAQCVVRKNERADFYPTPARYSRETRTWSVVPEGRIYEPEQPKFLHSALTGVRIFNMAFNTSLDSRFVEERLSSLFAKNKSGRTVNLQFEDAKKPFKLSKTNDSGQFGKELVLPEDGIGKPDPDGFARYDVKSCEKGNVSGSVQLLQPEGTSVVSTIDDTIKITGTADRVSAAANTIFRPYRPVDGMPRLYQAWRRKGADFHYVSGMPRELFPSLTRFMSENGFPKGSVELRPWSVSGKSILEKLDQLVELFSDEAFKTQTVTGLIDRFPDRDFVLVGNSAVNDPEVFGEIARRFPKQVRSIYILEKDISEKSERYRQAFRDLPSNKWHLFRKPDELDSAI